MDEVFATYRQGQVFLDGAVDWPNGTRVAVSLVEGKAGADAFPQAHAQPSADELEQFVDEACHIVETARGNRAALSDFAVSREGVYRDHW